VNLACRYQRECTDRRKRRSSEQLQCLGLFWGKRLLLPFNVDWPHTTSRQGRSLLVFLSFLPAYWLGVYLVLAGVYLVSVLVGDTYTSCASVSAFEAKYLGNYDSWGKGVRITCVGGWLLLGAYKKVGGQNRLVTSLMTSCDPVTPRSVRAQVTTPGKSFTHTCSVACDDWTVGTCSDIVA